MHGHAIGSRARGADQRRLRGAGRYQTTVDRDSAWTMIKPERWRENCCSARAGDAEKIGSLEARAADQRAVDVGDTQQLTGIRWLDRAAVENAGRLPFGREARNESLA